MMVQYLQAKEEVPGAILLFRMGDFYEMFGEDAERASGILEITLTARDAGKSGKMPMCGVPFHAAEGYIAKLVNAGLSVAICEQMEAAVPGKLVRRTITSVVTPGTLTDLDRLDAKAENVLMACTQLDGVAAAAFLDLLGGGLRILVCEEGEQNRFLAEVERLGPAEIVLDQEIGHTVLAASLKESFQKDIPIKNLGLTPGKLPVQIVRRQFEEAALKAWGLQTGSAEERALALLLEFLAVGRIQAIRHAHVVQVYRPHDNLRLDPRTIANLELVERLSDRKQEGSLLSVMDYTRTPMGGRLLRSWLLAPSLNQQKIEARLGDVEALFKKAVLAEEIAQQLKPIRDLARLAGRIALGLVSPRELQTLKNSLLHVKALQKLAAKLPDTQIAARLEALDDLSDVASMLESALQDDPPAHTRDGGFIRLGFNAEVDELRSICTDAKSWIAAMEEKERTKSGIRSLKVGFNRVFGYYLEVTKANLASVPEHFERRQTLAGAERFVTPELKEMEQKILGAEEKLLPLEQSLYKEILETLQGRLDAIQRTAAVVGRLDALLSLAQAAREMGLSKPQLTQDNVMRLKGCFHPVVKQSLAQGSYIPNDTHLGGEGGVLHIITGPNMGGKSTTMRQVALTQIMAQMGSFVPAKEAIVGLADAVLTRIGATDDVGQGLSTFMVEMVETSQILATATEKSLVLLDEVGRGTSTADGMAIARAVAEDLASRIRARTMFATHFHSLGDIADRFDGVRNFHVSAEEKDQRMIFKRVLKEGATGRSFGIQVARLAGLPHHVIVRSLELMADEEGGVRPAKPQEDESPQLSLFAPAEPHWLEGQLRGLDLDLLTPREAMDLLYKWKGRL